MPQLSGKTVSFARPISSACGLPEAFAKLRSGAFPWLLDSALPSQRLGRFSFAGADPYLLLRARGRSIELECRRARH